MGGCRKLLLQEARLGRGRARGNLAGAGGGAAEAQRQAVRSFGGPAPSSAVKQAPSSPCGPGSSVPGEGQDLCRG